MYVISHVIVELSIAVVILSDCYCDIIASQLRI